MRGLANGALPASTSRALSAANFSTGKNTSPRTSISSGHVVAGEPVVGTEEMVRTLSVTSSPVAPLPRVSGPHQPALLVEQVDGHAVDLELAQVVDRGRALVALDALGPGGSSSAEKALSRLIMRSMWSTAAKSVENVPPTVWVGESGVRRSGCSASIACSSRISWSYSASRDGRVVAHEVVEAHAVDALDELGVPVLRVAHGCLRLRHLSPPGR